MWGARGQRRGVFMGQIDPNLTIRYTTTKSKIFWFLISGKAELLPSPAQYILLNSALEGGP
jgi:hypothetical protein